jgi:predicted nucleic acid-binding Zn ribbon protein
MKKRKNRARSLADRFHSTCGWCGKTIPPDTEVFGFGAKLRPDVDLSDKAGQVVPVYFVGHDKTVLAAVAGLDSDAKREGKDVVFMICSEACGHLLRAALQGEIRRGDQLGLT